MKKILALFLAAAVLASAFSLSSCKQEYKDPTAEIEVKPSTDKYRNYYEIFVGAFNDSDGDGVGDLRGIIDKLDYLNDGNPKTDSDLGIDGIWLTPIMPSQSYHKYDVSDYYGIDENFGTLDDFDELVTECHKRGINLIIDMVLNHCSNVNPLFKSACEQALKGNLKDDAAYFEIAHYDENPGDNYTGIGKGYYYESNFSPHMPEWNLNADCTREYFKDVAEFWLKKHDVDGFRLDATLYYNDDETNAKDFLSWYYSEAQKIKPDVYMVGENWTGNAEIIDMYKSGADSFFAFGFAGSEGNFVNAVRTQLENGLVSKLVKFEDGIRESNASGISAYFLSNHDQVRSRNYISGKELVGAKQAAALYLLLPGNPFIYYGEEIGLTQNAQDTHDEYKREPMIWDVKNLPGIVTGGMGAADADHAEFGGVKQQEKDENSLLSFYKRILKIKYQNPEIARGKISAAEGFDDPNLVAYTIEHDGSKLLIIHNLASESKELELTESQITNPVIRADLVASEGNKDKDGNETHINLDSGKLTLLPNSAVVLKAQ